VQERPVRASSRIGRFAVAASGAVTNIHLYWLRYVLACAHDGAAARIATAGGGVPMREEISGEVIDLGEATELTLGEPDMAFFENITMKDHRD
jgi:hypothetical protein